MISQAVKCVLLCGLHWTCVDSRDLYLKQEDWRWVEQGGGGGVRDEHNEGGKRSKKMWSWREAPESDIVGLKESSRTEMNENIHDLQTTEDSARIPFHIISVRSTTRNPRQKMEQPSKQYVPFNRWVNNTQILYKIIYFQHDAQSSL